MPIITVRHATDEQIEAAKALTGEATAAKALVSSTELAEKYKALYEKVTQDRDKLRDELQHMRQTMEKLGTACDEVFTIVRQEHLWKV